MEVVLSKQGTLTADIVQGMKEALDQRNIGGIQHCALHGVLPGAHQLCDGKNPFTGDAGCGGTSSRQQAFSIARPLYSWGGKLQGLPQG
eukprot:4612960-Ditylum_brightwellii.AAC.1